MEEISVTPDPSSACLSVVIPVYNERETLAEVVEKILRVPHLLEVIVVDDCSTDGTREIARDLASADERIRVVHLDKNSGKTLNGRVAISLPVGSWLRTLCI